MSSHTLSWATVHVLLLPLVTLLSSIAMILLSYLNALMASNAQSESWLMGMRRSVTSGQCVCFEFAVLVSSSFKASIEERLYLPCDHALYYSCLSLIINQIIFFDWASTIRIKTLGDWTKESTIQHLHHNWHRIKKVCFVKSHQLFFMFCSILWLQVPGRVSPVGLA